MAGPVETHLIGHCLEQHSESVSLSNLNAPQFEHCKLSVPISVVLLKLSGW